MTWRIKFINNEYFDKCHSDKKGVVVSIWHDQLLPLTVSQRGRRIGTIASQSRDGELITNLLSSWKFTVVRGSSSRGGARALVGAKKLLTQGLPLAITVDGPIGPRHEMKPGAVYVAKLANAEIIPVFARFKWYLRFNSWDKFLLPLPFTRVEIVFTEPVTVSPEMSEEAVEADRQKLEKIMLERTRDVSPDFI